MEYTVYPLAEGFWAVDHGFVRSYLLAGEEEAVLVDTCDGGDILSVCKGLTDAPITLVTTHSDGDHIGGDHQFSHHVLHPAEFERYARKGGAVSSCRPLWEGTVLRVGGFTLETVLVPGHTPGSIALLDRARRILISGDTVQDDPVFMHGDGRDLHAWHSSLERLEEMRKAGLFDTVYPSHGQFPLPADIIGDQLSLARALMEGRAEPVGPAPDFFPDTVKTYRYGRAKMFY